MSERADAWERARRMKEGKRTFAEIAKATGLPVDEIARELSSSRPWTQAQLDYLDANASKPPSVLAKELSALGAERTAAAVDHKRAERNLVQRRPRLPKTWPVMRLSPEERDAEFVRLVQAEALRVFYRRAA